MTDPSSTRDRTAARTDSSHDSTSTTGNATAAQGTRSDQRRLERVAPRRADGVRMVSFWLAIVLPALYVPLLLYGFRSWLVSSAFLCLLGLNCLAFYVGHSHRR